MPDATFERATQVAAARGLSRSELITRAVQAYLDRLETESLTGAINEAVALIRDSDDSAAAVAAGRARLDQVEDDW